MDEEEGGWGGGGLYSCVLCLMPNKIMLCHMLY